MKKNEIFAETNRLHSNFEIAEIAYEAYEVKDYGDLFVNTDVISRKLLSAIVAGDNVASSFSLLAYLSAAVIEENISSPEKKFKRR